MLALLCALIFVPLLSWFGLILSVIIGLVAQEVLDRYLWISLYKKAHRTINPEQWIEYPWRQKAGVKRDLRTYLQLFIFFRWPLFERRIRRAVFPLVFQIISLGIYFSQVNEKHFLEARLDVKDLLSEKIIFWFKLPRLFKRWITLGENNSLSLDLQADPEAMLDMIARSFSNMVLSQEDQKFWAEWLFFVIYDVVTFDSKGWTPDFHRQIIINFSRWGLKEEWIEREIRMHPVYDKQAREILQIDAHADAKEVKNAYRRLSRRTHPDLGGDPEEYLRIQRAYETLVWQAAPKLSTDR